MVPPIASFQKRKSRSPLTAVGTAVISRSAERAEHNLGHNRDGQVLRPVRVFEREMGRRDGGVVGGVEDDIDITVNNRSVRKTRPAEGHEAAPLRFEGGLEVLQLSLVSEEVGYADLQVSAIRRLAYANVMAAIADQALDIPASLAQSPPAAALPLSLCVPLSFGIVGSVTHARRDDQSSPG